MVLIEQTLTDARKMMLAGDAEEAEAMVRKALADNVRAHGEQDIRVGLCLATLGEVLVHQQRPHDAIAQLAAAFRVLSLLPNGRRPAAECLDWIGLAYEELGDLRHAEHAYLEGLHFREKNFGKLAPEVADSMDHLFHLYHDVRHKNPEAEAALRRGLEILSGAGADHLPHIVAELRALGSLYEEEGRWPESVRAFERAVKLAAGLYGAEDRQLGPMLRELGRAFRHAGDLARAEYCLRRALVLYDAQHGGTPESALEVVRELALLLGDGGKVREEQEMTALAVMIKAQSTRPPPPKVDES